MKAKILVVDDEPEIRRFLRASLKTHQHEIHEANTGESAINAVREVQPDLMILDLGLPDMDGVEVIRRVHYWNQVPIIILSATLERRFGVALLAAGTALAAGNRGPR